jgi:hypothetical protein
MLQEGRVCQWKLVRENYAKHVAKMANIVRSTWDQLHYDGGSCFLSGSLTDSSCSIGECILFLKIKCRICAVANLILQLLLGHVKPARLTHTWHNEVMTSALKRVVSYLDRC